MTELFSIRTTDQGAGDVFDAFFAGYRRAFTLPDEMEDREGFAACLTLNHGARHSRLAAEFGPFRELCLTFHEPDGHMAGGANFFALAPVEGPVTVNLNYIYVVAECRERGYLRRIVQAVAQAAAAAFDKSPNQVLIFIEQNDPLRMSKQDQARDMAHSGMDQYERLAIWARNGALVVDFPYVQPPLSPVLPPDRELVLSVIGHPGASLPAYVLHHHLRGFFGISVAKGAKLDASAREQLDRLAELQRSGQPVSLIDPTPALALPRPRIGEWPDFRTFARHAANQAPISS